MQERTTLLKVASIIEIVIGAIVAIVGILVFAFGNAFLQMSMTDLDPKTASAVGAIGGTLLGAIFIIVAALFIASGIMGLKAGRVACLVMGIIMLVFYILSMISNFSVAGIFLVVLFILHVLGAYNSK